LAEQIEKPVRHGLTEDIVVQIAELKPDLLAEFTLGFAAALALPSGSAVAFCPGKSVVRTRAQVGLSILLIAPLWRFGP
jgi:hypothetical protein